MESAAELFVLFVTFCKNSLSPGLCGIGFDKGRTSLQDFGRKRGVFEEKLAQKLM
jgi:hypothetical protein